MSTRSNDTSTEAEVRKWFDEVIHEKKYFPARIAHKFAVAIGQDVELTVKVTAIVFLVLLVFVKEAHLLANFAILLVPFLQTYVFPSEKPRPTILFIHHIIFGSSILFDRLFEIVPCYYVLKTALFLALYHPPSNRCIDNIEKILTKLAKQQ